MRIISIYLFILLLSSCTSPGNPANFDCISSRLKYGSPHYLEVPIDIIPHKSKYNVGDTLTIRMQFSDSIMDLTRQQKYKIEGFPFEAITQLYKIDVDNAVWESGNRSNEIIVEEKYNPRFNSFSTLADDMRGHALYLDNQYWFEYKIALNTAGKYCTLITDQYENNRGQFAFENDDINAIEFEGKCVDGFFICSLIKDDPHYELFREEMIFFDKEISNDNFARIDGIDEETFGKGRQAFEWKGIYFFEVAE